MVVWNICPLIVQGGLWKIESWSNKKRHQYINHETFVLWKSFQKPPFRDLHPCELCSQKRCGSALPCATRAVPKLLRYKEEVNGWMERLFGISDVWIRWIAYIFLEEPCHLLLKKKDNSLLKCFVSYSMYVTAFSQGVCQHTYFSATSLMGQNIQN